MLLMLSTIASVVLVESYLSTGNLHVAPANTTSNVRIHRALLYLADTQTKGVPQDTPFACDSFV